MEIQTKLFSEPGDICAYKHGGNQESRGAFEAIKETLSEFQADDFCAAYLDIIQKACYRLQQNRFACFVVSDVRDNKTGTYRGLPGLTVEAFLYAGLALHNEAILVTPAGTLPVRAAAAFLAGRKLGRTHQNVLVFVKGDPASAARRCEKC